MPCTSEASCIARLGRVSSVCFVLLCGRVSTYTNTHMHTGPAHHQSPPVGRVLEAFAEAVLAWMHGEWEGAVARYVHVCVCQRVRKCLYVYVRERVYVCYVFVCVDPEAR